MRQGEGRRRRQVGPPFSASEFHWRFQGDSVANVSVLRAVTGLEPIDHIPDFAFFWFIFVPILCIYINSANSWHFQHLME